eukprot:9016828-Ditylum_brightwellii.AAC.1
MRTGRWVLDTTDYLLFIELIWKEIVEETKKSGTISRGLHGGRQGHDAKTLSLIEELIYNISYSSCKSLINFDNDAASCYNRILPNISSFVARQKGMHKNIIFIHATTLEKAKYRLKTALGVSEGYYSHCKTFLIYGSGQGATNSPHTWLVISSTICDIYEQSAHGAEFVSPDQGISILLAILEFVDDVNNQ